MYNKEVVVKNIDLLIMDLFSVKRKRYYPDLQESIDKLIQLKAVLSGVSVEYYGTPEELTETFEFLTNGYSPLLFTLILTTT